MKELKALAQKIEPKIQGWSHEGNFVWAGYHGAGEPLGCISGINLENGKIVFSPVQPTDQQLIIIAENALAFLAQKRQ